MKSPSVRVASANRTWALSGLARAQLLAIAACVMMIAGCGTDTIVAGAKALSGLDASDSGSTDLADVVQDAVGDDADAPDTADVATTELAEPQDGDALGDDAGDAGDADDATSLDADASVDADAGDVATSCKVHSDCGGATPACDVATGQCVQCLYNGHCKGAGALCISQACHAPIPCTASECGPTSTVCDPQSALCVSCLQNSQCPIGTACLAKQCLPVAKSCSTDGDCATLGKICNKDVGVCSDCLADGDCPSDAFCFAELCLPDVCVANGNTCIDGNTLGTCNVIGSALVATPCGIAKACEGATCVAMVCSPGLVACEGDAVATCNALGTAFSSKLACLPGQSCKGAICLDKICDPGAKQCDGNSLKTCDADALAWSVAPCPGSTTCEAGECKAQICVANAKTCDAAKALLCDAKGLLNKVVQDCGATGLVCSGGACVQPVCDAGAKQCLGDALQTCNPDSLGWSTLACGAAESCSGGACKPQICKPNSTGCAGTKQTSCDAKGLLNVVAQDCATAGQICKSGACVDKLCEPGVKQCTGNTAQTCNADASSWTDQACGSGTSCDAGECKPQICPVNAKSCDGSKALACDSKGLLNLVVQDCAANQQVCLAGGCLDKVCSAGAKVCNGNGVDTCKADSLGWTSVACGSNQVCDAAACKAMICVPNSNVCSGAKVVTCDAKGLSTSSKDCTTGGQVCNAGACVNKVCTAGAVNCVANTLHTCNADSLGYTDKACAGSESCNQGQCKAMICSPNAKTCSNQSVVTCDAKGLSSSPTQDCTATGLLCSNGSCVPKVCAAGSKVCEVNTLRTCNTDSLGYTDKACGSSALCLNASCVPVVCKAGELLCDQTKVTKCNATGTGTDPVSDCAATKQGCSGGKCIDQICPPGSALCSKVGAAIVVCSADGTSSKLYVCEDGDFCTVDTCDPTKNNSCQFPAKDCSDGNPCTIDGCSIGSGDCGHDPASGACDDGSVCTSAEYCQAGKCLPDSWIGVTTVAGTGTPGAADGAALSAQFNAPVGVAVTAAGTIYVTESSNQRIRKIADGTVTTLAGSTAGFADGTGAAAKFNSPFDVVVDAEGNLFVADIGNHRIRKVTPAGVVTTLAGDGTAGNLDGPGNVARFSSPYGLAIDASNTLYVADTGNHRIRKVSPGGVVKTVAGSTQGYIDGPASAARFSSPIDVALDASGNIYVSDMTNQLVRRIAADAAVTTVAGTYQTKGYQDGPGSSARFVNPMYLHWTKGAGLLVGDSGNFRLRTVAADGTTATLAGSGSQGFQDGALTSAKFNAIYGMASAPGGTLYVCDMGNYRVRALKPGTTTCNDGNPCTADLCDAKTAACSYNAIASGTACTDGNACTANDVCKNGVCAGSAKSCDDGNQCTEDVCNPATAQCETYATAAPCSLGDVCQLSLLCNAGTCATGQTLLSTIAGNASSGYINANGAEARFGFIFGLVRAADGTVYVADRDNNRIRKVAKDGAVTTFVGTGVQASVDGVAGEASFSRPYGIAIDAVGNLFVTELAGHRIRRVTPSGYVTTFAGTGTPGYLDGAGNVAQFNTPMGIAIDGAGNLFVAESGNHRIRKISAKAVVGTLAGSGSAGFLDGAGSSAKFNNPAGVAVDGNGIVYVADPGNQRVRSVDAAGNVSTLAGTGAVGNADGPLQIAAFSAPYGVALDIDGSVLVADAGNDRVRRIDAKSNTTTIAGSIDGFADGASLSAKMTALYAIAVDASGNAWLGDAYRLRMLAAATTICDDFSACTNDSCSQATGKCTFAAIAGGSPCSDGNACTAGDSCDNSGGCKGNAKSCDDSNACTLDLCNPYNMDCEHLNTKDACSDGNACTLGDQCLAGKCVTDQPFVYTLAGSASAGLVDGISADARFSAPRGVAVDALGNVFVADYANHRIRKIAADGTTSTFAGSSAGFVDGQLASAKFNGPRDLAFDGSGNLFVADFLNNRIRKIAANGTVSTVAGSGAAGFVDGAGSSAQFSGPIGLAVGPGGKLFIADANNLRVRMVATDGTVSTLAGSGQSGYVDGAASSARFSYPAGIAVTSKGVVYIADTNNHAIRRIIGSTVDTYAGGKTGFADGGIKGALFTSPYAVAVDASGAVFVADVGNKRIRKIYLGQVSTLAGTGTAGWLDGVGSSAKLLGSINLTVAPSSHLYLSEDNVVRKITQPALICDDGDACTLDVCDKILGTCAYNPIANGGVCDDGNACTDSDVCQSGSCAGQAIACSGGQICGNGTCGFFAGTSLLTLNQQIQLNTWAGTTGKSWLPCYIKSTDGASSAVFHKQCDGKAKTITVLSANNQVFGGFATAPWQSSGTYISDSTAFLFSVTKVTQHVILGAKTANALFGHPSYGPTFGAGHDLHVNAAMSGGYTAFGVTYTCGAADCKTYLAGLYDSWLLGEVEVFVAQ